MVIERTYKCNMCNKVSTKSRGKDLIGLYWMDYPSSGWIEKPSHEVENHICMKCIISLQKVASEKTKCPEDGPGQAGKEEITVNKEVCEVPKRIPDVTTLKYELSDDGLGLKKWFRGESGEGVFYHIHSDEMTKLEQWIYNLLFNEKESRL